jgi:branched-chain amino acid transport system permease protein
VKAAILDGIVLGLYFGMLGAGLTLVYGLGGVVNLAHGQIAVLAATVTSLSMDAGVAAVPAIFLGLAVGGALGLFLDLTLMQPVYRLRGEDRILLGLLLMLGVAFVIDGYLIWQYPIESLRIRIGGDPVSIIGVKMSRGSLVASGIALAAGAALIAFFRWTRFGRAVRSVIQNEEGARICGINPALVRTFIFALSGVLAALAVVARSMTSPVTVSSAGITLTTFALIVAVVGGLGSVGGALLAGVLLGVVNTLSSFYIGTYITTIILLAAAALTIVLRPSGLLGHGHSS